MLRLMGAFIELIWTIFLFIVSLGLAIFIAPLFIVVLIPVLVIGVIVLFFIVAFAIAAMVAIVKIAIFLAVPSVILYIVLKLLKIL